MEIRGETPLLERSGFSPAPLFPKNFHICRAAGPTPLGVSSPGRATEV